MHEMLHSGAYFLVLCTSKLYSIHTSDISRQETLLPYPIYSTVLIAEQDFMYNDYHTHSNKRIAVNLELKQSNYRSIWLQVMDHGNSGQYHLQLGALKNEVPPILFAERIRHKAIPNFWAKGR